MSDIVIDKPASATTIEAELNYLEFTGEKPVSYQYDPPPGVPKRSGVYRTHRVPISNARVAPPPGALSLDRNGFELHRHPGALRDFSHLSRSDRSITPKRKRCSNVPPVPGGSSCSITRCVTATRSAPTA